MRRTAWTVLLALLLQWVSAGAWAWRAHPATEQAPACHSLPIAAQAPTDTAWPLASPAGAAAAEHDADAPTHPQAFATAAESQPNSALHAHLQPPDSHHCCAVAWGLGLPALPPALAQAAPSQPHPAWASLSLRPDLRPPNRVILN